jgi:hypothetical protein
LSSRSKNRKINILNNIKIKMLKTLSRRVETSRAKFNTRFYKIFFKFKTRDALPTENKRLFTYILIRNGVFIDNRYNGYDDTYELDKKIQGIIFYYEKLSYKDEKFDYPIDKYEIVFGNDKLTVINRKTNREEKELLSRDYQFLYVYDNIIYYIDPLSLKNREIQTALYDDKIDYKLLPYTNIEHDNTCELKTFKPVKNYPNKFKNNFSINVSHGSNADVAIVIEKKGNKYVFSNSSYKKAPIHLFTINDNYSIKFSKLSLAKNEIDVIENYQFYYTECDFTIEIIYTSDTNIFELNKLFKKNKTPIKINIILDIPFTDTGVLTCYEFLKLNTDNYFKNKHVKKFLESNGFKTTDIKIVEKDVTMSFNAKKHKITCVFKQKRDSIIPIDKYTSVFIFNFFNNNFIITSWPIHEIRQEDYRDFLIFTYINISDAHSLDLIYIKREHIAMFKEYLNKNFNIDLNLILNPTELTSTIINEEKIQEEESEEDEDDEEDGSWEDEGSWEEVSESSPEEARRRGGFIGINRKIRKLKQY